MGKEEFDSWVCQKPQGPQALITKKLRSSIVVLTQPLLLLYTAKKVVHNSCNTGTCDLPDNVCTCACVITIKLVQHVIRTTI